MCHMTNKAHDYVLLMLGVEPAERLTGHAMSIAVHDKCPYVSGQACAQSALGRHGWPPTCETTIEV